MTCQNHCITINLQNHKRNATFPVKPERINKDQENNR